MRIESLERRIWFLTGQLAEAKKVYEEALGELNAQKQNDQQPVPTTVNSGQTVQSGESA